MAEESVPKLGKFFLIQKGDPDWRKSLWIRLKFNHSKGILSGINILIGTTVQFRPEEVW
jgi:hypothetical protein